MSGATVLSLLARLGSFDPAPLFVLSLLPYLAFLIWAGRLPTFPKLALRGFQFTLAFVAVTIAAAILAELRFGRQLADVDGLHGGAESLLTLSNLLILLGFQQALRRESKR
ncbi:MAG: DUF3593 domain-containing protein [Synechococcaceae cyanobacterium]|nr:DUF3593 domain-containing protein [Synechococcaceae cyanobacterium]